MAAIEAFMAEPENMISVEARSVYGNILYYPVNDKAKAICGLTGNKTIRREDTRFIEALGFRIITVDKAPKL